MMKNEWVSPEPATGKEIQGNTGNSGHDFCNYKVLNK